MIELICIAKTFNAGKPNRFVALAEIDLKIDLKRIILFKGPSGSGKTTLLSIIGCMLRPTSGRVLFEGREMTGLPERFLAKIRRESFGFVFQHFNLIKGVTVLENIMLPAYPTALPQRQVYKRAIFLLESFGICAKAHARVQHLSGGEQQRAAIARALINDPQVVIADEPTAHLNTELARQFLSILATLKNKGKTVLVASHDPILADFSIADRIIELRDGRIMGEG